MIEMQHVSKIYRTDLIETHALRDFNLKVAEGEFLAVTGPSGSGKTTFLNVAGLIEEFEAGVYRIDGVDTQGLSDNSRSKLRNEKIGFIFQSFNLIPDLNIFDNIDVPLRYRRMTAAERKRRITAALERVGLMSRAKHIPSQLSGGQLFRVVPPGRPERHRRRSARDFCGRAHGQSGYFDGAPDHGSAGGNQRRRHDDHYGDSQPGAGATCASQCAHRRWANPRSHAARRAGQVP